VKETNMKTLVIFARPDGPLLSAWLDKLLTMPDKGRSYIFDGKLFEVVNTIESLDELAGNGDVSDEHLLQVLIGLYGPDKMVMRMAGMLNISGGDDTPKTGFAASILLTTAIGLTSGAERLLIVELKQSRVLNPAKDVSMSALLTGAVAEHDATESRK